MEPDSKQVKFLKKISRRVKKEFQDRDVHSTVAIHRPQKKLMHIVKVGKLITRRSLPRRNVDHHYSTRVHLSYLIQVAGPPARPRPSVVRGVGGSGVLICNLLPKVRTTVQKIVHVHVRVKGRFRFGSPEKPSEIAHRRLSAK